MRIVLNIIWLVLAGFWLALGYCLAAVLLAITIIGLPFAKQALKLAGYALWPFGRTLVPSATRNRSVSVVGNVLWFVLAGWWLALEHLFVGIVLCITIIGIPLGVACFKMAGAALVPFGKEIVILGDLSHGAAGSSIRRRPRAEVVGGYDPARCGAFSDVTRTAPKRTRASTSFASRPGAAARW